MSTTELAHRPARRFAWAQTELVEGTEALLWPAQSPAAADVDELPDPSRAEPAVLSWVRRNILRFETRSPEPLAELLLVSTLAIGGPAQFVVRKQYQIGNTAACEPPRYIRVVERRDLFRVPVATRVKVGSGAGQWSLYSLDCSLGGLRICPPQPLEVGAEIEVTVELRDQYEVTVGAVVRHCHAYKSASASVLQKPRPGAGQMSVVGLQFLHLSSDAERHLSHFVGYHQRRLMPRVKVVTPVEYRSHGHHAFLEVFSVELSPGDVVFLGPEVHEPGERMEIKLRVRRQDYLFKARTMSCELSQESAGGPRRYLIRAFLEDMGDRLEAPFRKAVRDLALEKVVRKADR